MYKFLFILPKIKKLRQGSLLIFQPILRWLVLVTVNHNI